MINKKIGNDYENMFLKKLQSNGWWCHLFAYNKNGQPCDVIAVKDNIAWFIDVKHCEEKRFNFSNIQPNQLTCFEYANKCGNEHTGFAIYSTIYDKWLWLPYWLVKGTKEKSISLVNLVEMDL